MSVAPFEHPFLSRLLSEPAAAALFSLDGELAAMLAFERALSLAQEEEGLLPAGAARAIARAIATFEPNHNALAVATRRDGLSTVELVRQLRAHVGARHAVHVHVGATSQDVIDTALVARLATLTTALDAALGSAIDHLARLRARDGAIALMGRTRMQRALPVTAADRIDAWARPLHRQRARLAALLPDLLVVQLGGAVGTLEALGDKRQAVRARLATHLGLRDPGAAWHTARDGFAVFSGWLATTCGLLGKIGADLALMTQGEIAEASLAEGGGSSAMPHKANPVAAEILVTLARFAATLSAGMQHALVHENERSGAAWTLEWMLLPQLCVATAASLARANELLAGLTFRPAKAAAVHS